MGRCAEVYRAQTGVSIRLSGGGATLGIESAGQGGADFGGTCRHRLESRGEDKLPLALTVVAWDALVAVVHPSHPIDSNTSKQLVQVLQQKITDWGELGGDRGRIVVLARKGKVSGVGYMTRLLIFGDPEADYGKRVIRLQSSGPIERLLERSPAGIGVSGVSSARRRNLKILKIDGVEPSARNIAAGRYPYFRPLYLAHPPHLNASQKVFREWLLGPEGQRVVREQGTVNLEDGAGLVLKYRHWANNARITNYDALVAAAKRTPHARE